MAQSASCRTLGQSVANYILVLSSVNQQFLSTDSQARKTVFARQAEYRRNSSPPHHGGWVRSRSADKI